MTRRTDASDITKRMFRRYCLVQYSGKYNMIAQADQAQRAAGLNKSQYMAIIEHYDVLEKKYGAYEGDVG